MEFDDSMSEVDTWWRVEQREKYPELQERTQRFLDWLKNRPEQNIVVVSHGVWIECLLKRFLGERRVYNTDSFACLLRSDQNSRELIPLKQIHGQTPPRQLPVDPSLLR